MKCTIKSENKSGTFSDIYGSSRRYRRLVRSWWSWAIPNLLRTKSDSSRGRASNQKLAPLSWWRNTSSHISSGKSFITLSIFTLNLSTFSEVNSALRWFGVEPTIEPSSSPTTIVLLVLQGKGTFAPLWFLTTGGIGPKAMMFVKKLAKHMTRTNGRSLSNTMASIRRRLRFEVLKATLIAAPGHRGKYYQKALSIREQDLNLMELRRQVRMTCKITRGLMTYEDHHQMDRRKEGTW